MSSQKYFMRLVLLLLVLVIVSCDGNVTKSEPEKEARFKDKISSLLNCLKERTSIDKMKLDELLSLLKTYSLDDKQTLIDFFTKNYRLIQVCLADRKLPRLPDGSRLVDLNTIFSTKLDWSKVTQCLLNKISNTQMPTVESVLKQVRDGKYFNAIKISMRFGENGNSIFKDCFPIKLG